MTGMRWPNSTQPSLVRRLIDTTFQNNTPSRKLYDVPSHTETITTPADLTHSSDIRARAETFFASAGFDSVWTHRLVLVVDELFMNAVTHGSRPTDTITIDFTRDDDGIRCAVTDGGAAQISPDELHATIAGRAEAHTPHNTSGRGLAIITTAWTDGYTITRAASGGLTITFAKTFLHI